MKTLNKKLYNKTYKNDMKSYYIDDNGNIFVQQKIEGKADLKNILTFKVFNKYKNAFKNNKRIDVNTDKYNSHNVLYLGAVMRLRDSLGSLCIDKSIFNLNYIDAINQLL